MATANQDYPLVFKGELSDPPSQGWWLLKWLLGIPHYIILCFLWIALVVSWIISFFAILFTEKYPKGLFEFNVGVLRWSWRVCFYSYAALGTDKYPPFTLESVPDYPADLNVPYPEKLSRGLALVKWWLLAIPHYIIVSFFVGGWGWGLELGSNNEATTESPGLIFFLAIFAGIMLLFTSKYPQSLFKLVMDFNRWAYRLGVYVTLMTDQYPPFRLGD